MAVKIDWHTSLYVLFNEVSKNEEQSLGIAVQFGKAEINKASLHVQFWSIRSTT